MCVCVCVSISVSYTQGYSTVAVYATHSSLNRLLVHNAPVYSVGLYTVNSLPCDCYPIQSYTIYCVYLP